MTAPLTREEKSHRGPNLLKELADWVADERQRENWKDKDRPAYHYRRMVLEGAIREIGILTEERDEILKTCVELGEERHALLTGRDRIKDLSDTISTLEEEIIALREENQGRG